MADGTGVGSIFLDLIVRDTVQKQVNGIAAKAQASAKQSFGALERSAENMANQVAAKSQEAGQRIQNSISGAFNRSVAMAQAKVAQLETALASVTAKLNDAKAADNDAAAQRLGSQQEAVYDRLAAARERLAIETQAAAQKEAAAQASSYSQSQGAASRAFSAIKNAGRSAFGVLGTAVSKFKNVATKTFSGVKSIAGGLAKTVAGLGRKFSSAGKSTSRFGTRLKGIVSSALFFNILSRGLANMVKYMGAAIGSSEDMQTALANLKGAAATAAAPLWDVLTPALTNLANGAAVALSYISKLTSYFTSKTVASMAEAAKRIQKTADTAKKTTAGFDEIQKLGDSDSKAANYDFQGQSDLLDSALQALKGGQWGQIGQFISEKLKSALGGISDWIKSIDWRNIGDQIAAFLKNIDWGGIAREAFGLLGAAIGATVSLLWGAIDEAWAAVVEWWREVAYEDGSFTMAGLLEGIWAGVCNIGQWLWEHVVNPFINGFKEAFGIHSPSTVMAEMGGFLIQGFLNGIAQAWAKIRAFFGNAFAGLKDLIKGAINGILGFINGLISGVVGGVNLIVRAMNKLKFEVPEWVPGLGGKTFGFNLSEVSAPQIPLLANGGVIRQPTLAMMGEYAGANSNPEIVAPQSVIAETVAGVMDGLMESNQELVEILREILQAVLGIERGDEFYAAAVQRYNRKMAIARGGSYL